MLGRRTGELKLHQPEANETTSERAKPVLRRDLFIRLRGQQIQQLIHRKTRRALRPHPIRLGQELQRRHMRCQFKAIVLETLSDVVQQDT